MRGNDGQFCRIGRSWPKSNHSFLLISLPAGAGLISVT